MLLQHFVRLLCLWRPAFAQDRTMLRVATTLVALVCTSARRTLSNAIVFKAGQGTWAADYLAFSRSRWKLDELFDAVFRVAVDQLDRLDAREPVVLLLDDTSLKKSSRRIQQAQWLRDPLGPPFHVNLKYGLRCLHGALRLPLHKLGFAARAVSVFFDLAPSAKKPGRRATPAERAAFPRLQKVMSLGNRAVAALLKQRQRLDALGMSTRGLLAVVDGGYTNRTVLLSLPDRVELLGRVRKDIALCRPAIANKRGRIYGEALPTPVQLRQDPSIPYVKVRLFYGGKLRDVRYKQLDNLLWRGGAGKRPLRLFILAPSPYRPPGRGRKLAYGDPAYLICTDLRSSPTFLLQGYLDRWQIEPLHRDLKTGLGVGQAQAWSDGAVPRIHGALVATWSMLVLAALQAFGPARTEAFASLPPWRKHKANRRPSQNDLVQLLRADLAENLTALGPPRIPKAA
jgi:hypothetical protein